MAIRPEILTMFISVLTSAAAASSPVWAAAPAATEPSGTKVMLLVVAFTVGLLMFVWLASKLMGPDRPADDDNPFIPLGIGDEEDRREGDG